MGQITDDMIEGMCCSLCGRYFVERGTENQLYEHGNPVACNGCWTPECGYEKQDKHCDAV